MSILVGAASISAINLGKTTGCIASDQAFALDLTSCIAFDHPATRCRVSYLAVTVSGTSPLTTFDLTHRLALKLNDVRFVDDTVKNRVRYRWVSEQVVPLLFWVLAGNEQGAVL